MSETNGNIWDNMTMDEILYHPDFYMLQVFKGIHGGYDYWEVTFESTVRSFDGNGFVTFYGSKILQSRYKFYKMKTHPKDIKDLKKLVDKLCNFHTTKIHD